MSQEHSDNVERAKRAIEAIETCSQVLGDLGLSQISNDVFEMSGVVLNTLDARYDDLYPDEEATTGEGA